MSKDRVLVTGGSGFIAVHCIVQLLQAGYRVRTTVRSLQREAEVRAMVAVGGVTAGEWLDFGTADLEREEGWKEAAAGCRFVLHLASPFPARVPKHEDDLIVPAREGTLRVLRAARGAGVERVVMTSSFAAVGYGQPPRERPFDETDWTDVGAKGLGAYQKSKTLAERAAWDFVAREGGGLELSVVNPVGVFGPVLGPDVAASIVLVKRFLEGKVPGCPRLWFGAVDVRDVAAMHLAALTHPAAKGERFLAVAGELITPLEMVRMLKARMGAAAKKAPLREIPDFVLRLVALWDPEARLVVPELGVMKRVSGAKARRVLGWVPRSNEEAIVATGESLVRLGLVGS